MDSLSFFKSQKILTDFALKRLSRRLKRGKPILHYLPNQRYASIQVVRDPISIMILTGLIAENNLLSNEVILYNEEDQDILIQNLYMERLPHLLIASGINEKIYFLSYINAA